MEEGGLAGLERGQNEKKQGEQEEAVEMALSLPQRVCDHSQPHTDFPPNEKGVRKCNFSVCLLTDSLRFPSGLWHCVPPRPLARDRGAGRSEFRLPLEESHQEEVKGSVWAPGAWGFRTRR